MKTQTYLISQKDLIFSKSESMHDSWFSKISLENNCLILKYDNLQQYKSRDNNTYYGEYTKLTVRYILDDIENDVWLYMSQHSRKEMFYMGTVEPLQGATFLMSKYSIDMWDEMTLHFQAKFKKKWYQVTLEFKPSEIEYIWE